MTIEFDASLQAILNTAVSKTDWADKVFDGLGATRTIICKRDASSPADVFGTGTTFFDAELTGTMASGAGNIVTFGVIADATTVAAADLSTGYAILRISGGGHWMQGTLGLTGSGADFTVRANPTSNSGWGFGSACRVKAPRFLPSGTGPAAPAVSNSLEPATMRLYDWSDYTTPVLVDTITFDVRADDLVFDDAEIAENIGDVRIKQSSESIVYGDFEFGATIFCINGSLNDELTNVPVYQALVACKPYGRWAGYPAAENYDIDTDRTFPDAFKIELRSASGALLHTFEMRDGLAINDTRNTIFRTTTHPLRPYFNCGMLLPWQSHRLKRNTYASVYFAGVTDDCQRPKAARAGGSSNAAIPLIWGRTQANSALHWYALPRWPVATDDAYGAGVGNHNADDPNSDTNLFDVPTYYSGDAGSYAAWLADTGAAGGAKIARASGWDYEPGSISGHDWYTGPGGPRFDRVFMPTAMGFYLTNPSGTRPKNADAYRDMAEAWSLAYFNHSHHYVRDVKTFDTIPDSEINATGWSYGVLTYYGSGSSYVAGGLSRHVNQHAIVNGGNRPPMGPENLPQWNGWIVDYHHNYCQPGLATLFLNSPMHVYSGKLRYHANIMAQLGGTGSGANQLTLFGVRVQAWRYLHYVVMWKLGTSHALGMSRAGIEARFQLELEAIYDAIYVPAMVELSNDHSMKSVRELGVFHSGTTVNDGTYVWYQVPSPLWFYMGGALLLMKQTGLWAVMKAKSAKCSTALDFIVECLDKQSLDFIVETGGRAEPDDLDRATLEYPISTKVLIGNTPVMPTSWAEWDTFWPQVGSCDWMRDEAGDLIVSERSPGQHMRAQWAFIHRDYFPEIARANLTAACTIYETFYSDRATEVGLGEPDWRYLIPGNAIILPQPE